MKYLYTIILLYFFFFGEILGQTYQVKKGDTLFKLSQKYDISIEDIKKWNALGNEIIHLGQKLYISPPTTEYFVHTVQKGETLWRIARKYQVTTENIKYWNQLSSNLLSIGKKLRIGVVNETNIVTTPIPQNENIEKNIYTMEMPGLVPHANQTYQYGSFMLYEPTPNETLLSILKKFDMREEEWQSLNPELRSNQWLPKQEMIVLNPVDIDITDLMNTSKTIQNKHGENNDILTTISIYNISHQGTPTTSGELYNPEELVVAHQRIPLNSIIKLYHPINKTSVCARVIDRYIGTGFKVSTKVSRILGCTDCSNLKVKYHVYEIN